MFTKEFNFRKSFRLISNKTPTLVIKVINFTGRMGTINPQMERKTKKHPQQITV